MNRIVVRSRVGSDGMLHLTLPVGAGDAGEEVQVTVESFHSRSERPVLPTNGRRGSVNWRILAGRL